MALNIDRGEGSKKKGLPSRGLTNLTLEAAAFTIRQSAPDSEALALATEPRRRLWQKRSVHAPSAAVAERTSVGAAHGHARDFKVSHDHFRAGRAEFRLFKSQLKV